MKNLSLKFVFKLILVVIIIDFLLMFFFKIDSIGATSLLTLIVGTFTLIIYIYFFYEKQKNFLISIYDILLDVAKDLEDYKKIFIRNIINESYYDKSQMKDSINRLFKRYQKQNLTSKEIEKTLEKNSIILESIHGFCWEMIIKINSQRPVEEFTMNRYTLITTSIENLDYPFYSKNLADNLFNGFLIQKTRILKKEIYKLYRSIKNINCLVERTIRAYNPEKMLNFDLENEDDLSKEIRIRYTVKFASLFYQIFFNLKDLHQRILLVFDELNKFKLIKRQFEKDDPMEKRYLENLRYNWICYNKIKKTNFK